MVQSGQIPCKWVDQTWFQWGMPAVNVYFNELFIAMFVSRGVNPRCVRKCGNYGELHVVTYALW